MISQSRHRYINIALELVEFSYEATSLLLGG